jgi:hypothetical protein
MTWIGGALVAVFLIGAISGSVFSPASNGDQRGYRRPFKVRPDTIAACASALAAVASAIVAAYALVFLSHQEDIAKQQLQATYLSNLYTKQVDGIAALQNATQEFETSDFYQKVAAAVFGDIPDLPKYQNDIKNMAGGFL